MNKLRVFYNDSGDCFYYHGLEGSGGYPETITAELNHYPSGTKCLEISDKTLIDDYMARDNNTVVDGTLILGDVRVTPEPPQPRDLPKELDDLKAALAAKGVL